MTGRPWNWLSVIGSPLEDSKKKSGAGTPEESKLVVSKVVSFLAKNFLIFVFKVKFSFGD